MKKRIWGVAAVGAAGTLTAAIIGAQTASADSENNCVTLNVMSRFAGDTIISPPEVKDIGLFGTYTEKIYATPTSTEVIATGLGTFDVTEKRPSDGHIIKYVAEEWQFPDGDVAVAGDVDNYNVQNGLKNVLPLRGLNKKYAGMYGTLSWTVPTDSWNQPGWPTPETFHFCKR
jgi:hypothetical protein